MFRPIFFIFVFFSFALHAQNTRLIKILQAESFSFDQEKTDAQILKGNVICEHEGTLLHCDTAYFYEKQNRIVSTGHILITKGDSIRVTGEKLNYDGKTRMATLQNNVKCVEKDMTLTTNVLTFDVARSVANYYNGGTLVHKDNTLVSKNGHYYSSGKEAAFHYDVVLTNPQYTMKSDTLRYKIGNKTAYFFGPSIITSKSDYIYCENGWYDTGRELAQFSRNALLVTSQQKLRGDSLLYNRNTGVGRAFRNVSLVDTSQKSIVYGEYIEYKEKKSEALITGKALYVRLMDQDSLFVAADTLYHVDLDSTTNFLNAFHHVRIFKNDLQGMSDSATFNSRDSLMQLYNSPFLWSKNMQATAKHIKVDIGGQTVKGFKLDGRALLIQLADSMTKNRYNQIAAKVIDGTIQNDTIRRIKATGSSEIYYYPKSKNKLSGLNKTTSENLILWFERGEVSRINFNPKTEGRIDPLTDADPEASKLKGFNWIYDQRPKSRFELHAVTKTNIVK